MSIASGETSILRFRFEDFIRNCYSSKAQGILADSAATDEGGNNWKLILRKGHPPRTSPKRNGGENRIMISMALVKETLSRRSYDETTKFSFIVRDRHGNIAHEEAFLSSQCKDTNSETSGSLHMFVMSSFKVDDRIIVNGTLTIEVVIQVQTKPETKRSSHCNPFGKNMLNLFQTGARADVAFKVDEFTIRAHKFILEVNAPALARLCEGHDLSRPVRVFDASPEAFGHVLRYIYGGEPPETGDMLRMGKDLIAISYRLGVTSLKIEAECKLVEYCVVDVSNCVDFIFFADKHKCPSLKEHAISYLVARSNDVLDSESSNNLKENPKLMQEVMLAMADGSKYAGSSMAQKQTMRGLWKTKKGRRKNSAKQMKTRLETKGAKARQVSPNVLPLVYERACAGYDRHASALNACAGYDGHATALDADKIRRDAKRLLEAAEYDSLQKPRLDCLRTHGNDGWIVSAQQD
eukprot:CAMPEP_0172577894 /NCGR_PEP_ID=MMETSP1067-20121228/138463_1 /TAXON_ID=265564 ORGANISM="Thalassiosira punctigera, Strain Tpunct2005C2" /NCGR_SAMPLE_ID=MMETSP1067 /ASSEMBLY_ACC=CAM_ASM_000444 /LENGTH=465 /DNA_ID=CAMNT_0013370587 /DNA_START=535 /DNA_END=1932 /DNA_ORIENTATION=+